MKSPKTKKVVRNWKGKINKIYEQELRPLIVGFSAAEAMHAEKNGYVYHMIPITLESEIKRAVLKIARAYQLPTKKSAGKVGKRRV